jgi:hypothetical protein
MTEHIAAFAEFLNSIETARKGDRARITAQRILRICDNSADVPGDIEALLREEFDRARARP